MIASKEKNQSCQRAEKRNLITMTCTNRNDKHVVGKSRFLSSEAAGNWRPRSSSTWLRALRHDESLMEAVADGRREVPGEEPRFCFSDDFHIAQRRLAVHV